MFCDFVLASGPRRPRGGYEPRRPGQALGDGLGHRPWRPLCPGPPGAGLPPRRRDRHRSAQPRGEADQARPRPRSGRTSTWAHFHLGGPPPGALVAVTRRAVRDGPPPDGLVERVVAEGPLTGLRDLAAGLVARVKRAAQAYEEARQEALEAERRRAEAEEALAARAAEEAQADALAAADSRFVASLVPPEALARIGGLAEGPRGRLGPLLAEAKVLDWARRAVAAKPGLPKEAALAYYLAHEPPPGPAPPLGADAAGPGVAEALSALAR